MLERFYILFWIHVNSLTNFAFSVKHQLVCLLLYYYWHISVSRFFREQIQLSS